MLPIIIFCYICNPQGVRCIEQKRSTQRGDIGGRLVTDGRARYKGSISEAEEIGWSIDEEQHIFP